jgi:hypothetical protein
VLETANNDNPEVNHPGKNHKTNRILVVIITVLTLMVLGLAALLVYGKFSESKTSAETTTPSSSSSISVNANKSPAETFANIKNTPKYQNARTDLPYDELFRNSDKYKGTYAHYTGKVIQTLGEAGYWNLRVNITKKDTGHYSSWDDTVYVISYAQNRVIEKDIIEFTGLINGVETYKATMGQQVTIPSLTIYEHNLAGKAE